MSDTRGSDKFELAADTELKPCPFCGTTPRSVIIVDNVECFVGCACGAGGPIQSTREKAEEAWNGRAESEAV